MLRKRQRQMELIIAMFESQIEMNKLMSKELQEMVDEINKIEDWINNHDCK